MKLIQIPVITNRKFKFEEIIERTTNKGYTWWFYPAVIFRFKGEEDDKILAGKDMYNYLVESFAKVLVNKKK